MNIKNKRLLKSLAIVAFLLVLSVIFSDLLHQIWNWLLVAPVLSTIQKSIWTDISFVLLTVLLVITLFKWKYKTSGASYTLQGGLAALMIVYAYHRLVGSRYIFADFSILPELNYADLMFMVGLLYLVLSMVRGSKQTQPIFSSKNSAAQSVIKNYLNQKTNYALLINGKRGTGKTYFMKNTIEPMIDKMFVSGQQEETYKTIFISLYGLKSIDDLYFQLALNIKPYLKHLTVQSGSVLAGILARGLMNLSGAGSLEEYIGGIRNAAKDNVQAGNFVMIFDDLDRISNGLSIDEFIGFVNSMVEHENNKVMIIADELQIEQKELYTAAREKSIGVVVDFRNDFQRAVSQITNERFKDELKFRDLIIELEPDILKVFKVWKSDNLRTFIYFLNHFQQIYRFIDSQKDEPALRMSKLRDAAEYCMLFCIEFSKGLISFSTPQGVNDPGRVNSYLTSRMQREMFRIAQKMQQEKTAEKEVVREVPYIELFAQNFNRKNYYYFYKSIFDFVTGGDELNTELLGQELQENVTDRIFKPTEQELVYQRLNYPDYFNLSNQEYIELSERMFNYAMQGEYPLARYREVYIKLTSYPKIKAYDNREISDHLIIAMQRNKDNFAHDPKMEFPKRHIDRSSYTSEEKKIDETIREINNAIGVRDSMFRRRNLFSLFSEDPEKFYDACNRDYVQKPVFDTWDFSSFFEVFKGMQTSDVMEFNHFIKSRYGYIEDTSWVEYGFISNLFDKARTPLDEDEPFTFRRAVEDQLSTILMDIIRRYSEKISLVN